MRLALRLLVSSSFVLFARAATADDAPPPAPAEGRPAEPEKDSAAQKETLARHERELAALRDALEAERRTHLRISGYVQADWVMWRQSSQDEVSGTGASREPLNETRVLIRRGHVRADVEHGHVLGNLELDANTIKGPTVRVVDAEASFRWPVEKRKDGLFVMATLGLFKTPFGFEVGEADNRRPFLERTTMANAFFPGAGYDLGARIQGGWRAFRYQLGLMNGDPIGERAFPGRDPNKSKDLVFRVGVDDTITDRVRVIAGFSGVSGSGFHEGTPATKDVLVWRDANEDGLVQPTEIQVIAGTAATPSQNFHRFALGADLRVTVKLPKLGELSVRSELAWASNLDRGIVVADPVATGRDLRERGWYLGATQELTRWAMVGVRYDRYNPDADARDQRGATLVPKDSSFSTLAIMAMGRYGPGRLIAEYDHNTNPYGRTAAGIPTTLADDAFTLRAEVSF